MTQMEIQNMASISKKFTLSVLSMMLVIPGVIAEIPERYKEYAHPTAAITAGMGAGCLYFYGISRSQYNSDSSLVNVGYSILAGILTSFTVYKPREVLGPIIQKYLIEKGIHV